MREIPVDELEPICPAIHAAAVRVGCTHVRITGRIWPGGRTSGPEEEAIRVVEYSWSAAAVVKGEAFFEEDDPKRFAALLVAYGLADELTALAPGSVTQPSATPEKIAEPPPQKATLKLEVQVRTKLELERLAAAAGLSVAGWLDRMFA